MILNNYRYNITSAKKTGSSRVIIQKMRYDRMKNIIIPEGLTDNQLQDYILNGDKK